MDNESFQNWMRAVSTRAKKLCNNPNDIYYGEDGCRRFAKECGYAIPDFTFDRDIQNEMIQSTYSCICVIAYDLKPPIDAKEWFAKMREGRDRAMEIRENEVC